MEQGSKLLIPTDIPPLEVVNQLERILNSTSFRRSVRLSRFLRYTVRYVLDGNTDKCKEFLLGMEVFDKPSSFDPRIDSIVRVEACRLRLRLRRYYESEGKTDTIVIEYPKGSYVPSFCFKEAPATPPAAIGDDESAGHRWRSIAVLPFADLSPGTDQGYLADGLADEIIHVLTRERSLKVVSQTSAFKYKGKAVDIRQIGRDLQADTALEGSLRKEGPILRITAQLVSVQSGYILWSGTYERLLEDTFAVQKDVSRAIATALRTKLRTNSAG